ncbi:MAG: hypothetical protein IPM63_01020 [Acidobacteriota bacterium]|nr:MAG: hypothetical protein IPM63_01020 [Acidobacteriota bacterium]
MNRFTRIVCFILVVSALVLLALGNQARSQLLGFGGGSKAAAENISGDRFTVSLKTDKGATVYATRGVSKEMLDAIDKGLTDLFAIAKNRQNRFTRSLRHRDYTIFVGSADRTKDSKGSYSPDIAVGAAQYTGTKYDKGGYIYAAGMVISPSGRSFLIAEHTRDFERVSRVVRYEGEHIVLYHNDRAKFRNTMDHSRGGGHPILK